ncbi:MAG TPA: anti-sigma factor [Gaiellaceae bacterium]|nr:anti-sigma factor [Gaiellaceae bacterium]
MTDGPDFRELVGEDLPREEEEQLRRVHDLLVAAGPPPELPPHLQEPVEPEKPRDNVSYLPRRRTGLLLGLAAAIALVSLVLGYAVGARKGFKADFSVPMHATAAGAGASATIHVGELDSAGNWPLKVEVKGLEPLPKGGFYEMYLTRGGKPVATCGTFRAVDSQSVRLNAPYKLSNYTGWVVTREGRGAHIHPIVLRTDKI